MKKNEAARRSFVKRSAIGLGGLALGGSPLVAKHLREGGQLPADKKLTILCVGAHPGDPEFGCGGTLAKYSDAGHKVTVLYLNRGEAYSSAQTHDQSASLRTREAETSCKILNATPMFAGQIDGEAEYTNKKSEEFNNLVIAANPDMVLTHWPLDAHKDHQVAGLLTLNAWVKGGQRFQLFFYEVNTGDETMGFSPTDYEDITDYRARKKSALLAHKTQDPAAVYEQFFKTMEDFRGLEAGVKAAEAFMHFKPKSERAEILRS